MAELVAFLWRDDFPKSLFHLGGLLHVIDKADEIAEADAVRVGHDGRLSVNVAENEVGALSADAGERKKLLHVVRNNVMVLLMENLHACTDVACLGAAKSAGADNGFDFLRRSGSKRCDIRIFLQKIHHHHIDPRVGALRGKTHADKKLPGILIVQRTLCVRVFLFQPFYNLQRQCFFFFSSSFIAAASSFSDDFIG